MKKIAAEKDDYLNNCFFVKTVLMFLVVLYHSTNFWTGTWFTKDPVFQAEPLSVLSSWLGSIHTYGFALVSGYIFYNAKYECGKYQEFKPFVINKAKRLIIPYFAVAALWVVPIQRMFFDLDIWTIVKNYLFGINPSQLWFLLMLFDVFVIFWWLSDFFVKSNFLGAAIALLLYGVGLCGSAILPNIFMIWQALAFLPAFWIGFKLRQYGMRWLKHIPSVIFVFLHICLFVLYRYLTGIEGLVAKLLCLGVQFVLRMLGGVTAFVVLQRLAGRVNKSSKLLVTLSKNSMTVYLLHQQIIYFFIVTLNGIINPYLNALVNFVASTVISLLIATVLNKFRITRFMIGEKE